jgi:Tfp pilus assembly protein PilV
MDIMKKNTRGLTLMEIIVATVILALAVGGLVNLFITGKRYAIHNRSRMSGGELGRVFLEPLQMYVRQDTWDKTGNALKVEANNYYCDSVAHGNRTLLPGCPTAANQRTLDGTPYVAEYNISDMKNETNSPELRRVVLNVRWQENQP